MVGGSVYHSGATYWRTLFKVMIAKPGETDQSPFWGKDLKLGMFRLDAFLLIQCITSQRTSHRL